MGCGPSSEQASLLQKRGVCWASELLPRGGMPSSHATMAIGATLLSSLRTKRVYGSYTLIRIMVVQGIRSQF